MKNDKRHLWVLLMLGISLIAGPGPTMAAQESVTRSEERSAPVVAQGERMPLADRLLLQNAVAALWDTGTSLDPGKEIRPDALPVPAHVFIDPPESFFYRDGVWEFEGVIRRMAPREDGIEAIAARELFHMVARKRDGGYRLEKVEFHPIPSMR